MVGRLRREFFAVWLMFFVSVMPLSAQEDHNLTDTQLHAVMGIITNFILSSDEDNVDPLFLSSSSISVAENQTSAITLVATDVNVVTYAIHGADSSSFTVDANTGVVTFINPPDYESAKSAYTFVATATDSYGNASTQTVTITIINVAENVAELAIPTFKESLVESGHAQWKEDNVTYHTSPTSWVSGDINDSQVSCMQSTVSSDVNISVSFIYKVSSESCCDKLQFYVDDALIQSYADSTWTTAEQNISMGSHTLKWCYTKDGNVSSGADVAWVDDINISDVNFSKVYQIAEDLAIGTIGNIDIVPKLDAQIAYFSIAGEGNESFSIDVNGSFMLDKKLDYETKTSYVFDITAHNSAGDSNTIKVKVNVTDVDDLYISHAFFDDNGTLDVSDDTLYLQYSKAIDIASILSVVSDNFVLNSTESLDSSGSSSAEYNSSVLYYPHIISLVDANVLLEQNISIAPSTMQSNAMNTDMTKTKIIATTGSRNLKKTGQVNSYAGDGTKSHHTNPNKDDGYYQSGVAPQYSRDDNTSIVTDHITNLQWADDGNVSSVIKKWVTQANYDAGNYADTSGDTATTYCNNLTLGGFNNWRLPSIDELMYIADRGKRNPAIDTAYFQNVSSFNYWSSTTVVGGESNAWIVYFVNGYDGWGDKSFSLYVRCVRDGQ